VNAAEVVNDEIGGIYMLWTVGVSRFFLAKGLTGNLIVPQVRDLEVSYLKSRKTVMRCLACSEEVPPDHLLLDNAPNLGPLISRWEINKFENC
jgi:hypothetical protein